MTLLIHHVVVAVQGTNAHAVITNSSCASAAVLPEKVKMSSSQHTEHVIGATQLPWKGGTTWVHPAKHALVDSVSFHVSAIPPIRMSDKHTVRYPLGDRMLRDVHMFFHVCFAVLPYFY
jgi:hypothetical protein